jgi:hypothetical protein
VLKYCIWQNDAIDLLICSDKLTPQIAIDLAIYEDARQHEPEHARWVLQNTAQSLDRLIS